MISTVELGDQLRDYVVGLLEADGHLVVREPRANTKKVDIILRLDDEYVPRIVAIECKNVGHSLSQKELSTIYADHLSLIESKRITEVWVISRLDLSPEARNWADNRANLFAFSIAEFEDRSHGFRKYVRQVVELFTENDLDRYYIQQSLKSGELLRDRIFQWIDGNDTRPIALLGGYGMGKTSFCRYLVSELGRRYLTDAMNRVPIYIRLSDIAKQQELDGLIAKTLAQRYRIKDYHFEKFTRLNEKGKFVLIFDGFDEMKHALSWAEFKFNFSQINSTIKGQAKVIVAGRPNAFLSDDEHNWVLRGVRMSGERVTKLPDWPAYDELEISSFSEEDAINLLRRYLENHLTKTKGETLQASDIEWIDQRIAEFKRLKRRDEMFRPVHTKIFSDIAADPSIQLRDFSVFELYQLATSRISERESTKVERSAIDSDLRQRVIEETAWWLWDKHEGRVLAFKPFEIPSSLVRQAFGPQADLSDEAMYREIFSGSFIERKFGENFFFAHRSFLEFFVAKKMGRSREQTFSLGLINQNINPEILTFMAEGRLIDAFLDHVGQLIQRYSGSLQWVLLSALKEHITRQSIEVGTYQVPAKMILRYLSIYGAGVDQKIVAELMHLIASDFAASEREKLSIRNEEAESAFYFGSDFVRLNLADPLARPVAELLLRKCMKEVNWHYWSGGSKVTPHVSSLRLSRENLFEYALLRNARLAAERDRDGHPVLLVDFELLFNDLYSSRPPRIVVTGTEPATSPNPTPLRFSFPNVAEGLLERDRNIALQVLGQSPRSR